MRRYQGRIIATVLAMTFIMFWNFLFYGVLGNKINWTVDLLFTLVTLISVWSVSYTHLTLPTTPYV